ncbi:hypothetical protein J6590_008299, partial [Homalodisca vitripennis]
MHSSESFLAGPYTENCACSVRNPELPRDHDSDSDIAGVQRLELELEADERTAAPGRPCTARLPAPQPYRSRRTCRNNRIPSKLSQLLVLSRCQTHLTWAIDGHVSKTGLTELLSIPPSRGLSGMPSHSGLPRQDNTPKHNSFRQT